MKLKTRFQLKTFWETVKKETQRKRNENETENETKTRFRTNKTPLPLYAQGRNLDHMTGKCFASRNKLQQEC